MLKCVQPPVTEVLLEALENFTGKGASSWRASSVGTTSSTVDQVLNGVKVPRSRERDQAGNAEQTGHPVRTVNSVKVSG